jgi:hypothetical protein
MIALAGLPLQTQRRYLAISPQANCSQSVSSESVGELRSKLPVASAPLAAHTKKEERSHWFVRQVVNEALILFTTNEFGLRSPSSIVLTLATPAYPSDIVTSTTLVM